VGTLHFPFRSKCYFPFLLSGFNLEFRNYLTPSESALAQKRCFTNIHRSRYL